MKDLESHVKDEYKTGMVYCGDDGGLWRDEQGIRDI